MPKISNNYFGFPLLERHTNASFKQQIGLSLQDRDSLCWNHMNGSFKQQIGHAFPKRHSLFRFHQFNSIRTVQVFILRPGGMRGRFKFLLSVFKIKGFEIGTCLPFI